MDNEQQTNNEGNEIRVTDRRRVYLDDDGAERVNAEAEPTKSET